MPTIPGQFKPLVSGYGFDEPGGVMRTEIAGGAARYALLWDRGVQRFKVTLILNTLQFSAWSAFYHHIIKKGAIAFDMPLDSGFGVSNHSVNIVPGSYSASWGDGQLVSVAFVVETENQAYGMSATDAQRLLDVFEEYGSSSNELLARIATFANSDTLVLDY